MDDKELGLYPKYEVFRKDGKSIPQGCVVLPFDDPNSWPALLVWANTVESDGYVELAKDVRRLLANASNNKRK